MLEEVHIVQTPTVQTQTAQSLEEKLIRWFECEALRAKCWSPRLFWHPTPEGSPYGRLRVDPRELEVIFATVLGEPSACRAELDEQHRGRGRFLAANARRHELPLLTRLA